MKKFFKVLALCLVVLVLVGVAFTVFANIYMTEKYRSRILSPEECASGGYDCILVLGAGIWAPDTPSPMLADRLERALEVYALGASDKLLMSGDHGTADYNEVEVMKNFAFDRGATPDEVFTDHAGFSTYESMYRARDVFACKKILIVTQEYHMYRALYIANELGLDAYGVAAAPNSYSGQTYRDLRELAARDKDLLMCLFKPEPTWLGEVIPISGSGTLSYD